MATKSPLGKSVSSSDELYVRVHDISDEDCSKVDASVKPPQISSGGDDDTEPKLCKVPDEDDKKYKDNPDGDAWNKYGGIIRAKNWEKNRRVDDQSPSPGSEVDCTETLTLEFDD
ncbi:hypothetical protein H8F24_04965 [Synechococcus sp. CBW1002]|uniref:hypothetical protein n=1 Tax=Synechococcus sp. CBW1002 TaxID=1353134 RepID=UPI0018CD9FCC|nr:hypothetical protein [Synechococcus sp. CBW1002]QPN60741.1 hypothetical protein H8F24_04965 [Synechococcus sp. CBW1002]